MDLYGSLVITWHNLRTVSFLSRDNPFAQLIKQAAWQHAVVIGPVRSRPEVVPWPRKAVEFVKANPVACAVKPQVPADIGRNLK